MGENTKKHFLKKYWWGVLTIVIILLLLPLILNWVVTRDTIFDCKIAGDSKDWLLVWITYLSVLSSMFMVFITYLSLRNSKEQNDKILQQNKEQLDEIKKEREEAQRARLVFDIIINKTAYFLRIRNIGKENAFNVSINVNKDFIQNLEDNDQVFFKKIKQTFYVLTDTPKYFFIGLSTNVTKRWNYKDISLSLNGTYCDNYQIKENINMNQFIDKLNIIIDDELTSTLKYFTESAIEREVKCNTIQRSLDIIAKNIGR